MPLGEEPPLCPRKGVRKTESTSSSAIMLRRTLKSMLMGLGMQKRCTIATKQEGVIRSAKQTLGAREIQGRAQTVPVAELAQATTR